MIPSYVKPFTYHIPWKSKSQHLGEHRGTERGLGFEYRGNVNLLDYPDARRLDLRETLRNPYEQIQVRLFNQDNTTPIFALCDMSSSMQFKGRQRKLDKAMGIASSIAYSAYQASDIFSFIGYDKHILEHMTSPLSHHVYEAFDIISQLSTHKKMRVGSEGILEVSQYLSQNKGLVFWISDFHMPLTLIEQALNMMSQHQVIPIVLWEDQEYLALPKLGFGTMIDPETGMNKTIFFRDAIREKFITAFEERKQALNNLFLRFESPALYLNEEFTPEALTQYFEQYMNL
ncbi:MAG: DUF58 domain-containing protein [Methylophilaceae bacterium]